MGKRYRNRLCSCLFSIFFISTLFHAPSAAETFQDALISAYSSSPNLQAERERVKEIDETYVQARSQGLLTSNISGTYNWTYTRSPGNLFTQGETSHTNGTPEAYQLQVIQPLYQGGRVKALKKQAKAGILAAREGLRQAEQSLFLSTANAYSDVRTAEEVAKIRRNNVRVLHRQKEAAQVRFDVGAGTRTDIAQADARLAAAEIGLAQADAQLTFARSGYKRATGHIPVDLQPVPVFLLPQNLTEAIRIGKENNPDMIAAIFNETAAEANIDVAKSSRRPSLSLNATAQDSRHQFFGFGDGQSATLSAQFSVPLLSGGLNSSRVRSAKAAHARSKYEIRDVERAIEQIISQSWAQMEASKLSLKAAERQVKAAEFAFEGVTLEQEVGTRSALDVLDAEQEVLEAKLAVVNSLNTYEKSVFQVLKNMGSFDAESLKLAVDLYDPSQNFKDVNDDWFLDDTVDMFVPEKVQNLAKDVTIVAKDMMDQTVDVIQNTEIP